VSASIVTSYDPALFVIKSKGYEIEIEFYDEYERWIARRGDLAVFGFNPLSLLGLIEVAETLGDQWRQVDTGDLYDHFMDQCADENPDNPAPPDS